MDRTALVLGAGLGDALVIALGAEYAPQAVPGLAGAGLLWHGAKVLYEKYWLRSRF